mmetsp:Transcript_7531/g.12422  ORF Transcript_7531/g.12422 Transcript_7531/m.12422 type:complete len:111 (-) Transcript_7531:14-346(-)
MQTLLIGRHRRRSSARAPLAALLVPMLGHLCYWLLEGAEDNARGHRPAMMMGDHPLSFLEFCSSTTATPLTTVIMIGLFDTTPPDLLNSVFNSSNTPPLNDTKKNVASWN